MPNNLWKNWPAIRSDAGKRPSNAKSTKAGSTDYRLYPKHQESSREQLLDGTATAGHYPTAQRKAI